ncbi:MAG: hypothetical protein NVS2B14_11220 [Chamaesiphon sp.]
MVERMVMSITSYQENSSLILVVDDDQLMRMQIRRFMEADGHQVVEATNGEEALATANRYHPDIVLLDAVMPVMDGYNCCTLLRSLSSLASTPVLMLVNLECSADD